jgi:predicted SAM-dependent methyltransferase
MSSTNIKHFEVYPNHGLVKERVKPISKLLYKIIPRHTFLPFYYELYLFRVRLFSGGEKKKYIGAKNLKVNIGCGPKGKQGWVNVDAFPAPGVNCIVDSRKSLPFPDNSVQMIFCEHFFEHVDYTEEAPHFISECYRVLQPGGVLRIIVPDIEIYLRGYFEKDWETLKKARPLDDNHNDVYMKCPYANKMELVNVVFRQGFEHRYAYDYENMEHVLKRFGFPKVVRQTFGQSLIQELAIDSPERASESLYAEAQKL